jgi:peptide/nickel transport system substrate-binding protein
VLSLAALALAEPFVWKNAWTAAAPGEASYGGTFRYYSLGDPRTLNPITSAEQNAILDYTDVDHGASLIIRGPNSDDYLPYAAQSYTVSDDGTVVDVVLRDGLKWSDGSAITPQDYYIRYVLETDPDIGSNAYDGWFVGEDPIKLEVTGDNSLRFTFPRPDRLAFPVVALTPVPDKVFGDAYRSGGAEAVKALWGTDADVTQTIWSSPWVPTSFTPGERITFERNPYFGEWNVDEQGNPLPYLDGMSISIVTDSDAALNLFLAGQIDAFEPRNLDDIGTINVAVQNQDIDATVIENASPVASSQFIVFNWNKAADPVKQKLFRSADFRRAMAHLIDRPAIIELVYGGAASPMYTSIYTVLENWVNNDVTKYDFDPEAASQLLARIGYSQKNGDGILVDADGNPLSFTLATNAGNNQREQIAQIFADSAREVGVDVKVESLDFNLLVDQLLSTGDDRPFDAILIGLFRGSRDWPFGDNVIKCDGNLHMYNTSGACLFPQETLMAELQQKGRGTLDNAAAKAIGDQIQQIESELEPILYTVSPAAHYSWLNDLQGQHPADLINSIVASRELELTFKTQ